MQKIENSLLTAINTYPKNTFDVLISIKQGVNPNSLGLKEYSLIMDEILSANLNSKAIIKLSQNDSVIFIEPNQIMSAM